MYLRLLAAATLLLSHVASARGDDRSARASGRTLRDGVPVVLAQAEYQDDTGAPDSQAAPAQPPPSAEPGAPPTSRAPSPPFADEPRRTAAVAQAPPGQWIYTQQYGWVWMPYADDYTYVPPDGYGEPYAYVYYPAFGWTWITAPWVWGFGPWPYFGAHGPVFFAWYRHGWWRSPWRWHFAPSFAFHGVRPVPGRGAAVWRGAPSRGVVVPRGHAFHGVVGRRR